MRIRPAQAILVLACIIGCPLASEAKKEQPPTFQYVRWEDRCTRLEIRANCERDDYLMVIRDSCKDVVDGTRMVLADGWCKGRRTFINVDPKLAPAGTELFIRSMQKGCDPGASAVVPECDD